MIGLIFFYTLSNPPIAPPLGSPTERPADPTASSPLAALIDLFAEGEKKYLAGDDVGALTVFGRAYEQSQDPTCLANMARIHEDLGEYDQAAELYRRFLRHPLASPTDRDTIAQMHRTFTLLMGKGEASGRRAWMEKDGGLVEADV